MNDFEKCSAILKGETEDSSIQSPLFEMNRLSTLLYHYTGLVKVRKCYCYSHILHASKVQSILSTTVTLPGQKKVAVVEKWPLWEDRGCNMTNCLYYLPLKTLD